MKSILPILVICMTACGPENPADLILYNGNVLTVDASNTKVQAIAVKGGTITATGSDESVLAHAGNETTRIDLDGKTVIPGSAHPRFTLCLHLRSRTADSFRKICACTSLLATADLIFWGRDVSGDGHFRDVNDFQLILDRSHISIGRGILRVCSRLRFLQAGCGTRRDAQERRSN